MIWIIVAVIAVVGAIIFIFKDKIFNTNPWKKVSNGTVPISDTNKQKTPKGADVWGKNPVTQAQLELVDAGLDDAFAAAALSLKPDGTSYDQALDHAHYKIWTPDDACVPSPEQHIASFKIRADVYDGTQFDQYNTKGYLVKDGVGVIFAAEEIRSVGTPGSNPPQGEMICCPDDEYLRDATRNGAEHCIIATNDNDYYNATAVHTNYFHPLLPKRSTPDVPFQV